MIPRLFSVAKKIPSQLFDLVLSDTFANAAKEFCETPAIAATVLYRHEVLCLGVSQHQIATDLNWDDKCVQGSLTELLVPQVVKELQILQESTVFSVALAALKKQGAYKGALTYSYF